MWFLIVNYRFNAQFYFSIFYLPTIADGCRTLPMIAERCRPNEGINRVNFNEQNTNDTIKNSIDDYYQ